MKLTILKGILIITLIIGGAYLGTLLNVKDVIAFDTFSEKQVDDFSIMICDYKDNNSAGQGLLIWDECIIRIQREIRLDLLQSQQKEDTDIVRLLCEFITMENPYLDSNNDEHMNECFTKYINIINS